MPTPRVETIQRRIRALEAAGYVVRRVAADGSIEVAKRGQDGEDTDELALIDMRRR